MKKNIYITLFSIFLLSACSSVEKRPTLRDIDIISSTQKDRKDTFIQAKSDAEIRKAYSNYLSNSNRKDQSRQNAIGRLAELEFEVSNQLLLNQEDPDANTQNVIDNQLYISKLNKAIELFNISLQDYPKAKNNDNILYQLAKAYDQKGDNQKSFQTLMQLINQYPNSPYYAEAQFRIAETNFSQGNYIDAEDAYTEVIISKNNQIFYEKAIFKRGWTRFKQAFYEDAVDDYLQTITYHNFDDIEKLDQSEKELFEEYFRAIGLSFSNLGGAEALHTFFEKKPDFKYLYYTYSVVSDIYLKQERYTDSADTLEQFITRYPNSSSISHAKLKAINIWQKSGFKNKLYQAIESFYVAYNVNSRYWKANDKKTPLNQTISQSLKNYVLLVSEYFHSQYQTSRQQPVYQNAIKWYQRYLKDYASYARQDRIYYRYAELLSEKKDYVNALHYYELAAYDGNLILDKKSAYATITLTNQLYNKHKKIKFINKHIQYAQLFTQLYTKDKRSETIIIHAAQQASLLKRYETTIELTNLLEEKIISKNAYNANLLRAQAYFSLTQYSAAEGIYVTLLNAKELTKKDQTIINDRLALSIYQQAKKYQKSKNILQASHHFMRISEVVKKSDIAATGMYDAIAIFMNNKLWDQAVDAIKRFQNFYPKHQFSQDVTKKLSIAYLNSNQNIKAAEQFEKISTFEKNKDIKKTALWQAAELYETNKNYPAAIRSYKKYANTYKTPYSQYIESMLKLTELYLKGKQNKKLNIWQQRIIQANKKAKKRDKTNRTKFIVATTTIDLARKQQQLFTQRKLVEPLKRNLRRKKKSMQAAIKLYGQASAYGIQQTTTESTYAIAQIYQSFSRALLNSERPKNLRGEELEQYNILLEDQAFPFEDKSIEFYEINLSRIKDDVYDDWVEKSLLELKQLFPVKYNRKSKIDGYINAIH